MNANAGATYYFQVVGGIAGDVVPILIGATLETTSRASQNPRGYAHATFNTFTSTGGLQTWAEVCTYTAVCQSFVSATSATVSLKAASGAMGDFVNLTAEVYATGAGSQFDEFATAFADPYIYIDPSFPNANLYSIVVSPDAGNAPPGAAAAPEPATLWFAGAGIGCLAVLRSRRGFGLRITTVERQRHSSDATGESS